MLDSSQVNSNSVDLIDLATVNTTRRDPDRLVYMLTLDISFGMSIAQQISHFGFYLQIVRDLSGLEHAIAEHHAVTILVDIASFEEQDPPLDVIHQLGAMKDSSIPLMFISERDDQATRLKAIRAGGRAFFRKPLEIVNLIDQLDNTQASDVDVPYRVLIIEDDPTVAGFYQMVLSRAGMNTQVAVHPEQALQHIEDFHPDLMLMDLYMPEVSGIDLARMIRQMDEYVSTPIVFLSSEDDFAKQMEAMSLGGDDFLTKPIKASHLVSLVTSRLERLRVLRSFMIRDSLTGLLNHTAFIQYLNQQVNRCRRSNIRMALAMLDLDHFKKVNDTYGHAFGDTILKGLSRMLKQRLRRSDIIGRYGGEEFVALLLDATPANAFRVMEDIRNHYANLQHVAGDGGVVTVTFSCGIATFPEFPTANQLSEAADKTLYLAKGSGRNKVLLSNTSLDDL
jgi:diguanylate cyclase (GGDEF)-like protein